MERIIVAFNKDETCQRIAEMLTGGGMAVRAMVHSGAEAKRHVRLLDGGVIICGGKFNDMTAMELADDLSGEALVLVVAPPAQLDNLGGRDNLFSLSAPVQKIELLASVRLLMQLDEKRAAYLARQRSSADREMIRRAKETLQAKLGMTEPEAHRYIQVQSMSAGMRSEETAKKILELYGKET